MVTQTRLVADCTPLEKGVVRSILQKYIDEVRDLKAAGKPVSAHLKPLRILEINGDILVTDGAHRLKALVECGELIAPVVVDSKGAYELRTYQRELGLRLAEGLKGGAQLKVCDTDEERQSL